MKKTFNYTRHLVLLIGLIAIYYLGFFIQLPYIAMSPGSAIELHPIVKVEDGYTEEKGTFMMTTVGVSRVNIWRYMYSQIDSKVTLVPSQYFYDPKESDFEDYIEQQRHVMKHSQEEAVIVAFQKAGVDYSIVNEGAVVTNLMEGMPAEKVLKAGDLITEVDGKAITTNEELITALRGRNLGEQVSLTVKREGKSQVVPVEVAAFPEELLTSDDQPKAGIGIAGPVTQRSLVTSKKVDFKTENVGGPSAGLMLALEIMNQLLPEDLTKGYRIAGTGEIEENGEVGRIGGIAQKVVAAKREEVDFFFAPNDNNPTSNYEEALQAVKDFNLELEVVPVKTIDDALNYLRSLPEKKKTALDGQTPDKKIG